MKIKTDFTGGNIEVIEMGNHVVKLAPQLRDTTTEWFYWAFCAEGAAGETWTFDFSNRRYIGYYGPAISHDLEKWDWVGADSQEEYSRFTYHFGEEEDCVYFAHSLLYHPKRFEAFSRKSKIPVRPLTWSEKGNSVDIAELGDGNACIILTSRHHCCESTGTYVLEGILEEFAKNPLDGYRIAAVPFIDIDGVLQGDQGKNRFPHDHNRDYIANPIYNSTSALMNYAQDKNVKFLLDLHSPWHFGGRNDTCFIVHAKEDTHGKYQRFGKILEEITSKDSKSMQYHMKNDIGVDVEWNSSSSPTCSRFFADLPSSELSFIFETAYFGEKDNQVTQEKLVRLGRNLAKALKEYICM